YSSNLPESLRTPHQSPMPRILVAGTNSSTIVFTAARECTTRPTQKTFSNPLQPQLPITLRPRTLGASLTTPQAALRSVMPSLCSDTFQIPHLSPDYFP